MFLHVFTKVIIFRCLRIAVNERSGNLLMEVTVLLPFVLIGLTNLLVAVKLFLVILLDNCLDKKNQTMKDH